MKLDTVLANPGIVEIETVRLIVGGGVSGYRADIRRPRAAGESGAFRGSHAIGACVDDNWPPLG